MGRINLNVPAPARADLRALAASRGRRESEMARELLLEAIERAKREEFFRQAEEAWTPERERRYLEVARAIEAWRDGEAG